MLVTPTVRQNLLQPKNHIHPDGTILRNDTTAFRQMLHDLLCFFAGTYLRVFNMTEGPPLHDPLAVAAVLPLEPSSDEVLQPPSSLQGGIMWNWEYAKVVVEAHGVEIGRTSKHAPADGETVVRVPKSVDTTKFWEVLMGLVNVIDVRGHVKWV